MAKRDSNTQRRSGGTTATNASGATQAPAKKPAAAVARGGDTGRSGGVVDAPGKKHRKLAPTDPAANMAKSQASKMRAAQTMVKTNRLRGRG